MCFAGAGEPSERTEAAMASWTASMTSCLMAAWFRGRAAKWVGMLAAGWAVMLSVDFRF